ncbi:hypothetical protein AYO20_09088 [Fonsecaea nubica]|uniref:Uncharacterized protein n=1 Tax=Fonsecaea nubica TaxID=856822 RepID=A0A178CK44_9EURO|nr:hypothetical protein AYO20_09088 [Fonsecaea nubica]OAL29704.1 hypothetical protein AYO20_09088 [Fonsecaea nubica]
MGVGSCKSRVGRHRKRLQKLQNPGGFQVQVQGPLPTAMPDQEDILQRDVVFANLQPPALVEDGMYEAPSAEVSMPDLLARGVPEGGFDREVVGDTTSAPFRFEDDVKIIDKLQWRETAGREIPTCYSYASKIGR